MLNTIKEDLPQYDFFPGTASNSLHWIERKLENPKNKIRLATMFSGIGAIEYALKRLKISNKIVFASDNDKFVKESYYANYKIDNEQWYNDVKDIDGKKYLNKIDLLVGGSPCQSFSMVGKRKGFEDTRGTLFYDFARVIKESQPKVFIYENVKGLTNHDKGNTFKTMKATFDELGYKYFYKTLNSKDYGVPQHRLRIFVVGFTGNAFNFDFLKESSLQGLMQDYLEDYIESKCFLNKDSKAT